MNNVLLDHCIALLAASTRRYITRAERNDIRNYLLSIPTWIQNVASLRILLAAERRANAAHRRREVSLQLQLIGQQRQIEVLRELDQLNVVSRADFKQRLSQHIQQKRANRPLVLAIQGST